MRIKYNAFFAVILALGVLMGIHVGEAGEFDWSQVDNLVLAHVGVPTGISYRHSLIYDMDSWIFAFHRLGCEMVWDKYTCLNVTSMLGGDNFWIGGGAQ